MKKLLLIISAVGTFSVFNAQQLTYSFSTCGATGRTGPTQSQVNAAYPSGHLLNGAVTSNSGIQTWTVPYTGPYEIDVYGAQGGNLAGFTGGYGAQMKGTFTLTAGTVLKILVGQTAASINSAGSDVTGGGGGSFVTFSNNSPLIVAGGGGGRRGYSSTTLANCNGTTGTSGQTDANSSGAGGTNGNGGSSGEPSGGGTGGPGGGLLTNGGPCGSCSANSYGIAFVNGGAGGFGNFYSGANATDGGFGGGGGGCWCYRGTPGAGGGYSGGGTGINDPGAGGGGSYNNGSNQTNVTGANTGNGKVIIRLLYFANVVQTSTIACNGQSVAALSTTVNGGVPPYTYTWLPAGGNGTAATNLSAGVYTLTAKDANNLLTSTTYTVNQPTNLASTISQTNALCYGQSNGVASVLASGGVGPYTYTWTGATSNASVVSGIPAGSYSVAIKDVNNCITNTVVTITQPASIAVSAGTSTNAVCAGNPVTLTGSGASTYTWNNGVSNASAFTPTATTNYIVTGIVGVCSNTAQVTVTVNPRPVISVVNGTICTGQSYTITASGASTYTYQSGGSVVAPTTNMTYTVTGSSAVGCVATSAATLNLVVNPLPVVAISGTNAVCNGNSIVLTGSGASTYTWTGATSNNATVSVAPTSSTTYSLAGTSSLGCVGVIATKAVSVYTLPVLAITGTNAICTGNSAVLTANGASTYTWLAPASNNGTVSVSPTSTSTYSLIGTSSQGCTGNTANVTVTVYALPVIAITGNTFICIGESSSLTATGASTYAWSSGQTTSSVVLTPTTSASYTVVGTSVDGCVSSNVAGVTVNSLPILSINGNFTICAGTTASLNVSGANTYSWNNGANTTSISITPTISGGYVTFSVAATSTAGCVNSKIDSLLVNALPTMTLTGGTSVCNADSIVITASGAATYSWSTGANTATVTLTPSVNTSYTVIGVSAENCSNSAVQSISVVAFPTIALTGNTVMCAGDSLTFNVSGADTYTWSTGSTNSFVVVHPATSGSIAVIGGVIPGCNDTAMVNITVNANPTVLPTSASSIICTGESIELTASGAVNYTWSSGATTASVIVNPTITSTYTVNATDANGCKADSTLMITVSDCAGLQATESSSAVLVYPNPNNGVFTIDAKAYGKVDVNIYSVTGQLIVSQQVVDLAPIDLSKFDNGVYLVRITTASGNVFNKHLIKQ